MRNETWYNKLGVAIILMLFILSILPAAFAQLGVETGTRASVGVSDNAETSVETGTRAQAGSANAETEGSTYIEIRGHRNFNELQAEHKAKLALLQEDEAYRALALTRAQLQALVRLDVVPLRAELQTYKIVRIKSGDELNERDISDKELARVRVHLQAARDNYKETQEALAQARVSFKEAQQSNDEAEFMASAKAYLNLTADLLIAHLTQLRLLIESSENIDAQMAASMAAALDTEIAHLQQIKTNIATATTRQQLRQASQELSLSWGTLRHTAQVHADLVAAARVEGIVNNGIVLEKKLDAALNQAAAQNSTIDVSTKLTAFSEKMSLAQEKQNIAQTRLSAALSAQSTANMKAAHEEATVLLKDARASLKEAHEILKGVVKEIKQQSPGLDLSSDAVVEVATS